MKASTIFPVTKNERKERMKAIGTVGGKSRSRKKLKAVNKNLQRAMAARFPNHPKWGRYKKSRAKEPNQSRSQR